MATPLLAQKPAKASPESGVAALAGTWIGTVTVPLGDSAIVAPVSYTFVTGANGMSGNAMVPGQGSGTISNVIRTGSRIQFRVTVTSVTSPGASPTAPRLLEHDAKLGADGALEGLVNMDGQPMAKFKVAQKK